LIDSHSDYLDVSDFPAPEPLQMALDAVGKLDPGKFLHFHHRRFPRLLFERLEKRGFGYDIRRGPNDSCNVFIWKNEDSEARRRAIASATEYPAWKE